MTEVNPPVEWNDRGPLSLERQLAESRRFYVTGIIENALRHDPRTGRSTPAPMRWGDIIEAESPRQAEDAARNLVHDMEDDGRRGNLWVAGVYQLNVDLDGNLGEPAFLQMDDYAKYVDPDLSDALS